MHKYEHQHRANKLGALLLGGAFATATTACTSDGTDIDAFQASLENRAYIVSLESDELTVIDLDALEIIGRVPTGGLANHMAELNGDFTKVYVNSLETDETIVVDAKELEVRERIDVGHHPSHLSLARDGELLAVMAEDEGTGAISFIDTTTDTEVKRLPGFYAPHYMRFSHDGRFGYVANIEGYHLTRVDLETLEIDGHVTLDGFEEPPNADIAPEHGGFADAQIDEDGVLYAAHSATGRVLVYDTIAQKKVSELQVGTRPWVAFAEHPFPEVVQRQVVPNFGDKTVSLLNGESPTDIMSLPGDSEAYGVNFSSRAPEKAFIMNRVREDVAVADMMTGQIIDRIPVGGNTETASTTADGKWIVAAVSDANRVVVIDAQTHEIVKTFENVGKYPWTVAIPGGQNYCH